MRALPLLTVFTLGLALISIIQGQSINSTIDDLLLPQFNATEGEIAAASEPRHKRVRIKKVKIEPTTLTIPTKTVTIEGELPTPKPRKRKVKIGNGPIYRSKTVYRIKAKKLLPNGHSYQKDNTEKTIPNSTGKLVLKRKPVSQDDEAPLVSFSHMRSGYKDTLGFPASSLKIPEAPENIEPTTRKPRYRKVKKRPSPKPIYHENEKSISPSYVQEAPPPRPSYVQEAPPPRPSYEQEAPPPRPSYEQEVPPPRPSYDQETPPPRPSYDQETPPTSSKYQRVAALRIPSYEKNDQVPPRSPSYQHNDEAARYEARPPVEYGTKLPSTIGHRLHIKHPPVKDIESHSLAPLKQDSEYLKESRQQDREEARQQRERDQAKQQREQEKQEKVSKKVKEDYEKDKPFFPETYYPAGDYFSKDGDFKSVKKDLKPKYSERDYSAKYPDEREEKSGKYISHHKEPKQNYHHENENKHNYERPSQEPESYSNHENDRQKPKYNIEENDISFKDIPPIPQLEKSGRGPRYLPDNIPPPPQSRPIYRVQRPPQAHYSPPEPHYYSAPRPRPHHVHSPPPPAHHNPHSEQYVPPPSPPQHYYASPLKAEEPEIPPSRGYIALPPQHKPYHLPGPPPSKIHLPPPPPPPSKHYYHVEPVPRLYHGESDQRPYHGEPVPGPYHGKLIEKPYRAFPEPHHGPSPGSIHKPHMRNPSPYFDNSQEIKPVKVHRLPTLHDHERYKHREVKLHEHKPRKHYYHGANGPVYKAPGYSNSNEEDPKDEKSNSEDESVPYKGSYEDDTEDEFEKDFNRVRYKEEDNALKDNSKELYVPAVPRKPYRGHEGPVLLRPQHKVPVYYSRPRLVVRHKPGHHEQEHHVPSHHGHSNHESGHHQPRHHDSGRHQPSHHEHGPPPPPPKYAVKEVDPSEMDPRALGFSSAFTHFMNKLKHFEKLYI